MRLFDDNGYWVRTRAGGRAALQLFKRHYSCRPNRGDYLRFVGPGEYIMLLGKDGKALFVWRKERYRKDGQSGVECSVFRNESGVRSSDILRDAEGIAQARWPGERLFTFVDPSKVKSANPGYCFKVAGWKVCGKSLKGLLILEKYSITMKLTA